MTNEKNLVLCYNRGCGTKFDPNDNKEDACQHHPGAPFFHDAYKGWSCCKKKCTDFSEFLSIKGCTKSQHTNVKPPETAKPVIDQSTTKEVIETVVKPLNTKLQERPQFDTPQVILKPSVSQMLLEQIKGLKTVDTLNEDETVVAIGQSCKNNTCKSTYKNSDSNNETCIYHSGVPIFHEGMKFWSCCQKRTTDFSVFLEQPGCSQGKHLWINKNSNKTVQCRMDWHQTTTHVYVSIFAKKYDPDLSFVKVNPIHLTVELFFPEENSSYNLDIELKGIISAEESSVSMFPTKTEIKLKKKILGSWSKLDIPQSTRTENTEANFSEENISSQVNAVDLSDI